MQYANIMVSLLIWIVYVFYMPSQIYATIYLSKERGPMMFSCFSFTQTFLQALIQRHAHNARTLAATQLPCVLLAFC